MMKARIAVVSISSLISLALVVTVIGCLEMGAAPTPTATPVPMPTLTPTPKPTATPYVSGPRPIYDAEAKAWIHPTATQTNEEKWADNAATVQANRAATVQAHQERELRRARYSPTPTRTPTITPTPILTPTITPTPVPPTATPEPTATPDYSKDFELLTPENEEIVVNALSSGELELPSDEVLVITGDVTNWIKIGYGHYHIASFMHRCLHGVEHPEAREQLDVQREFYGWDTLEFVRDASHESFSAATAFNPNRGKKRVESIYRIAEGKWLRVIAEVNESTCEMGGFGYSDLGKNAKGQFIQLQYSGEVLLSLGDDSDRWEWLLPITNAEAASLRFRCREFDYDAGHYKFCD